MTSIKSDQPSKKTGKEYEAYLETTRPTCYCMTAKADRSLTSTLSKPDSIKYMLDPSHWIMQKWVNLITVLLLFVAFVTPFEVAFLETKPDLLFVINRLVDVGFILDMVSQFFLPYYDSDDLVYVWNRDLIALNYAKLWFPLDLVSVLPYDFFGGDPFVNIEVVEGDTSAAGQLKVLRLVSGHVSGGSGVVYVFPVIVGICGIGYRCGGVIGVIGVIGISTGSVVLHWIHYQSL